jgi:hypothetical protein
LNACLNHHLMLSDIWVLLCPSLNLHDSFQTHYYHTRTTCWNVNSIGCSCLPWCNYLANGMQSYNLNNHIICNIIGYWFHTIIILYHHPKLLPWSYILGIQWNFFIYNHVGSLLGSNMSNLDLYSLSHHYLNLSSMKLWVLYEP